MAGCVSLLSKALLQHFLDKTYSNQVNEERLTVLVDTSAEFIDRLQVEDHKVRKFNIFRS